MAMEASASQYGDMSLVVIGAAFALVFLMFVVAGILKAAGRQEPTPQANEDEGLGREDA